MVVARGGRTEHRQRFVDVEALRVAGNDSPAAVRFFDEVVAVVGEDGCR